jgi:hypothetical protein
MAEGRRPGGLTALAVLNFVGGGLVALGLLALAALLGGGKALGAKIDLPSSGIIYLLLLLDTVTVCLLIAAGVGYLQMKRFLGRVLGNAYAVFSLISKVIAIVTISGSFGIGVIIGLVYPVLTLVLLNTTFKDDLVN